MDGETSEVGKPKAQVRLAPESFSDIIFGLALSIGSLILIQNQISTASGFAWNIVVFGFSFTIIAMTWLLFSRTVSKLSIEGPIVYLNLALFFCVALEPYLFYLLMNQNPQIQALTSFTSVGYALDVGFMFVILGGLSSYVIRQGTAAGVTSPMAQGEILRFKRMRFMEWIAGALFLISALPVFFTPSPAGTIRYVFWYSSFIVFLISRFLYFSRGQKKKHKSK